MRIGDLRHRMDWQSPRRVSDGAGGWTTTYETLVRTWVAIWPIRANELVASGQRSLEVTHKIRMRYRPEITTDWRGKFGSRYFSIVSAINPNEANRTIDLLCKESKA